MADDNPDTKKDLKVENRESLSRTIFSQDEIIKIVKGFVLAYLRGIIKIEFPTVEEIQGNQKKQNQPIGFAEAFQREIENKRDLANYIAIVSGTKPSTPDELTKATNELFWEILTYRSSQRIVGTFLEYKMEERLDDLERKLDATNKVVVELVNWLTDEARGNDRLP